MFWFWKEVLEPPSNIPVSSKWDKSANIWAVKNPLLNKSDKNQIEKNKFGNDDLNSFSEGNSFSDDGVLWASIYNDKKRVKKRILTETRSQEDMEKVMQELEDFKVEIQRRFKWSTTKTFTFPRQTIE